MKENPANLLIGTTEKLEDGIKSLMWGFLMDRGQEANIPALKEYVYDLIQATTQKSAGQNKKLQAKENINWKKLDMIFMSIAIEATALVLSGKLDELEEQEQIQKAADGKLYAVRKDVENDG